MSVLSLSYWGSDVYWRQNSKHFAELAPTKWRKTADMEKLRHCHPMYTTHSGRLEQWNCDWGRTEALTGGCVCMSSECTRVWLSVSVYYELSYRYVDYECCYLTYARPRRSHVCGTSVPSAYPLHKGKWGKGLYTPKIQGRGHGGQMSNYPLPKKAERGGTEITLPLPKVFVWPRPCQNCQIGLNNWCRICC